MKTFAMTLALGLLCVAGAPAAPPLSLTPIGSLKTGAFRDADPREAEINAYDAAGKRIYIVNPRFGRLDVVDITDPTLPTNPAPVLLFDLCQAALGSSCPVPKDNEPNSVAVFGNLLAVAVGDAVVRTSNGHAMFFELRGKDAPRFLAAIEVGAVPDMITFTDDGKYVLTADEGEPNQAYTIDPLGTVSIIEVSRIQAPGAAARRVDFTRFDNPGQRRKLEREGVRIFGPNASVSQDLEPEYIATEGNKAYVTLQENNALAIINIAGATVERVVGLGLKDHSLDVNALDTSDQDSALPNVINGRNIRSWPISGMYQPDAIQAFTSGGRTYLVMANEGDAREYTGYVEDVRLGATAAGVPLYPLDPTVFPNAAAVRANSALGRLNVSTASGDLDGDGDFDRIDVHGARSISVRDHTGALVWDSGDLLERLSEQLDKAGLGVFNNTNSSNARDNRSDDKGIEPESVVVGRVGGTLYAFVGLERDSGLVVFDLSDPSSPTFVSYASNRKFPLTAGGAFASCSSGNATQCGDLGPEGLTFVAADQSPTGKALLLVTNEVSGTTTVWQIQ